MIISEQFLKTIPLEYKKYVLKKLNNFEKQLLSCENIIRNLPAGYWVRVVKNTNIFKFRLNNKDRILFTYINDREKTKKTNSNIIFLSYVNHNEQIRVGKNLNMQTWDNKTIEIDKDEYTEDGVIDTFIEKNYNNKFIDLGELPLIVVNNENLDLLFDESNKDYFHYLSDEQYNVIKSLDNAALLSGSGGTGKTVVLMNILELAKRNLQKAIYVSHNNLLVEHVKNLYIKLIDRDDKNSDCNFYSMEKLEESLQELKEGAIVNTNEVIEWLEQIIYNYKALRNKDLYEILTELKGVIKGYLGLEYSEILELKKNNNFKLSLDNYLNIPKQYSSFNEDEKISLYKISEAYNKWLLSKNLLDENDIARKIVLNNKFKKYDWVIVDEVQDLTEIQIYMLSKLVKDDGQIIWAGDINQTINPTFFNYGRINNLYYTYNKELKHFNLKTNYRSTKQISYLINQITNSKIKTIGKSKYDTLESGIKNGSKPLILDFNENEIANLMKNIKDKHYCAIVVANENEKNNLILKFPEIDSRVFVVHEIKGLEYENIICYNILSTYFEIWQNILKGDCKHNNKMRYYFNLLYVAISRSKENLNIYEKFINKLDFIPFDKCSITKEYNEKKLGIDKESSKNDWKQEANRLETIGQIEKAKFIKRNLELENCIIEISKNINGEFKHVYNAVSKVVEINSTLDEDLAPGIIEYRKRQHTNALEIFNSLINKYPKEPKLYYYLANTYSYMVKGMDYSINFFKQAIELDPNQYEYYLDMACILKVLKRYTEALDILNEAQKKFPYLGNTKSIQAEINYELGNFNKARILSSQSNKLPKFEYDTFNKVWKKPKDFKKLFNKNQDNMISKIPRNNMKLPKGIEYIKILNNGTFTQCINEIDFLEIKYNKKSKRYNVTFNLELCNICENFKKCIASKADKQHKISITELAIKQLLKKI